MVNETIKKETTNLECVSIQQIKINEIMNILKFIDYWYGYEKINNDYCFYIKTNFIEIIFTICKIDTTIKTRVIELDDKNISEFSKNIKLCEYILKLVPSEKIELIYQLSCELRCINK